MHHITTRLLSAIIASLLVTSASLTVTAMPRFDAEDMQYLREDLASFTASATDEQLALAADIKAALLASAADRDARAKAGGALGYDFGDVIDQSEVIAGYANRADVHPRAPHPLITGYQIRLNNDTKTIEHISGFANHDTIEDCMQSQRSIVADLHQQFPDALLLSAAPNLYALIFTNDAIISVKCRNDTNHKRVNYQLGYHTGLIVPDNKHNDMHSDLAAEIEVAFVDAISIDAALTLLGQPTKFINYAIPNNLGIERALAIYQSQ